MNVETQMRLARQYAELWRALFADLGSPEWATFVFWAGTHVESHVVHGFNRAAKKVRKLRDTDRPMTLDDAVRYASSVMKNEKCGFRDFSGSRADAACDSTAACSRAVISTNPKEGRNDRNKTQNKRICRDDSH